jgi:hypothetical protein
MVQPASMIMVGAIHPVWSQVHGECDSVDVMFYANTSEPLHGWTLTLQYNTTLFEANPVTLISSEFADPPESDEAWPLSYAPDFRLNSIVVPKPSAGSTAAARTGITFLAKITFMVRHDVAPGEYFGVFRPTSVRLFNQAKANLALEMREMPAFDYRDFAGATTGAIRVIAPTAMGLFTIPSSNADETRSSGLFNAVELTGDVVSQSYKLIEVSDVPWPRLDNGAVQPCISYAVTPEAGYLMFAFATWFDVASTSEMKLALICVMATTVDTTSKAMDSRPSSSTPAPSSTPWR